MGHLAHLDESASVCEAEAKRLHGQLRDVTNRFEERIASSFCRQKRAADEKINAVACKECAHTAIDVIRNEELRRSEELSKQLGKLRTELHHCCAAYLRQERSRMVAASEMCGGSSQSSQNEGADNDSSVGAAAVEDAWRLSQAMLRRVEPLLKGVSVDRITPISEHDPPGGILAAPKEPALTAEDVNSFFSQIQDQRCGDCAFPNANWASVSFGILLCMDCAGKHRGLGVHLSSVRSTMDAWSSKQLQRIRLGGTQRFREFLEAYPHLRDPQTVEALTVRYRSRAAAYYKRCLDARCEGRDITDIGDAPSLAEGHLPVEANLMDAKRAEREIDSGVGTLEEERIALEAAHEKQKQRVKDGTPVES